uniref:Regulatory protein zeste n=1 Tax=Ceratitis capitata TaxID=7213 RepID=W8C6F3_CERCA
MGRHKNSAQELIMVNFMEEHAGLARGLKQNKQMRNEMWELLTKSLNCRGPPRKPPERWKKVWFDWRSSVKRKISQEKNDSYGADQDDIPCRKVPLTAIENKLARICGFLNTDTRVDFDTNSDIQEELSLLSDSITNVIKEELMTDEPDNEYDESPIDFDTTNEMLQNKSNDYEKSVDRITVRPFAICNSTAVDVKIEMENVEDNNLKKSNKTHCEESGKNADVLDNLVKQQTSMMAAVQHFLQENIKLQNENLRAMKEIGTGLNEIFQVVNKLNESTNDKLKEQRRHNYEIEKLRREEIFLQKQQLELNEMKLLRKD